MPIAYHAETCFQQAFQQVMRWFWRIRYNQRTIQKTTAIWSWLYVGHPCCPTRFVQSGKGACGQVSSRGSKSFDRGMWTWTCSYKYLDWRLKNDLMCHKFQYVSYAVFFLCVHFITKGTRWAAALKSDQHTESYLANAVLKAEDALWFYSDMHL